MTKSDIVFIIIIFKSKWQTTKKTYSNKQKKAFRIIEVKIRGQMKRKRSISETHKMNITKMILLKTHGISNGFKSNMQGFGHSLGLP